MKKLLLSLVIICSGLSIQTVVAQVTKKVIHQTIENNLFLEEATLNYLLADDVILRSQPDKSSQALDRLQIGSAFHILTKSDSILVINGIESNWYKIELTDKEGWIWGGFIASYAFGSESDAAVKFVSGVEKCVYDKEQEKWSVFYQIRAFRNNQQIDKISLQSPAWDYGFTQNIGRKGLTNVDDILTVNIPCSGGCGCLTGDTYVFWNNSKFYFIGHVLGTPDAEFSEGAYFIFPSDMKGQPGLIIKEYSGVNQEKTYPKNGENNAEVIYRDIKRQTFTWNGNQFLSKGSLKVIKTYSVKE